MIMTKQISFRQVALSLLFVFSIPSAANASLLGQTVTCSDSGDFFNSFCDVSSNTVGAGVEFFIDTDVGEQWEIDLGSNSVSMTSIDVNALFINALLSLGDLIWANDPLAVITGITNFNATDVTGMTASHITIGDHSLVIDYGGGTVWNSGGGISFELVTTHDVPEPATIALLGLGLAGMGFARRKKKSA